MERIISVDMKKNRDLVAVGSLIIPNYDKFYQYHIWKKLDKNEEKRGGGNFENDTYFWA